ncbi:hypothetical protein [Labedaea rhizosphaerae]|uniref:hypothetical protein n=1 Tax=Labedaea rhizosphaerae TaxID=598644 RepID=UPI0014151C9A|nr:hypothetical protein [Labedaea rhizosphaerae]
MTIVFVAFGAIVVLCVLAATFPKLLKRRKTFRETMTNDPLYREFKESGAKV